VWPVFQPAERSPQAGQAVLPQVSGQPEELAAWPERAAQLQVSLPRAVRGAAEAEPPLLPSFG
jgi:hypothetical protein